MVGFTIHLSKFVEARLQIPFFTVVGCAPLDVKLIGAAGIQKGLEFFSLLKCGPIFSNFTDCTRISLASFSAVS